MGWLPVVIEVFAIVCGAVAGASWAVLRWYITRRAVDRIAGLVGLKRRAGESNNTLRYRVRLHVSTMLPGSPKRTEAHLSLATGIPVKVERAGPWRVRVIVPRLTAAQRRDVQVAAIAEFSPLASFYVQERP